MNCKMKVQNICVAGEGWAGKDGGMFTIVTKTSRDILAVLRMAKKKTRITQFYYERKDFSIEGDSVFLHGKTQEC